MARRSDLQPILLCDTLDEWRVVLEWLNKRAWELPLRLAALRSVLEITLGTDLIREQTEPMQTFTVEWNPKESHWSGFRRRLRGSK